MPQKGSIVSNVFEQLEDLGKSTVKSTAKAVNQTFNPVKLIEEIVNPTGAKIDPASAEKLKQGGEKQSATPLDLNKLDDKYKKNTLSDLEAVRRQFNLVKGDEKRAIDSLEMAENERKRKLAQEEHEKEQRKRQLMAEQQVETTPQGKRPRGMAAAHKKKAQEKHTETKPSVGKQ